MSGTTTNSTQGTRSQKAHVAVVDDDPSFLRSMDRLLRIAGYRVSAYASARDFLKSTASVLPECLVVDMHMPEMSGIEMQKHLVAQGVCVPAILVTAHDTIQTREQARRQGFSALLFKPFDGEALLKAIEVLVLSNVAPFVDFDAPPPEQLPPSGPPRLLL